MPVVTAPIGPTHEVGGARFTSLATPTRGAAETAVWTVEIDPGTPAVPHALTREEVFVVLSGAADVALGDERALAAEGDAIVVPPDTRFAITSHGGAPVRLLCCLPVGGRAITAEGTFTPPWAL
ncbi:MAG: cupin domain-containing protein [Thermoleophilia bacterium]